MFVDFIIWTVTFSYDRSEDFRYPTEHPALRGTHSHNLQPIHKAYINNAHYTGHFFNAELLVIQWITLLHSDQ